jgi:tRNA(Ile)-lysidine synthase
MVEDDGVNFCLVKVENFDFLTGNIEDRLRKYRYKAFEEILGKEKIGHILVGHQKEDVEETVFKRILEGASLFSIPLFLRKKILKEITVHRPLIKFAKHELVSYLNKKNIQYFEDYTNFDTKFLRARMRVEIFPYLNEKFGKNIIGKFFDLAAELLEVDDYFSQKCHHALKSFIVRPIGGFLPKEQIHYLELKYIIKRILADLNQVPSKDALFHITDLAVKNIVNKKILLKDYTLFFEKSGIFFIKNNSWKINFKPLEEKNKSDSVYTLWLEGVGRFRKEDIPSFIKQKMDGNIKSAKAFLIQIE